jgi:PmbA protein
MFSKNEKDIRNDFINAAKELGIQKYDMFAVLSFEESASSKDGQPFNVNTRFKHYGVIRVWTGESHLGIVRTSDLSFDGFKAALMIASQAAQVSQQKEKIEFSPKAQEELTVLEAENSQSPPTALQNLMDAVVNGEKSILSFHEAFLSVPYNGVGQTYSRRFYINSENVFKKEDKALTWSYFYPLAQKKNQKSRQSGEYEIAKDFSSLDVTNCARKSASKTLEHLDYKPIKTKSYDVILSPEAFLDLLDAFSNCYNAQSILDNKSLFTEKHLDSLVASPLISFFDDPLNSSNVQKERFDEEGTPTGLTKILENGVLKSFLHSSFTAKKMKTNVTGNTILASKLGISSHYLHVTRGENPQKTYSRDEAQDVIYIDDFHAMHAGVNALQGAFSLPFNGWILNQGKRESIEGATVAGDFLKLLNDVIFVEKEEKVTPSGICPHIWFKELMVTGLSS